MNNNELYDEKFYLTNQKDIKSAHIILKYILERLKPKSVVDFGCGSGTWLSEVSKLGISEFIGIDGDYVNKKWLLFDSKKFKSSDLTKEIKLDKKFDLAISLEVAEHIDEKYSDVYLSNIVSSSDIILFSAAIPNQGGTNHINEQYPRYWINKFNLLGYDCLDVLRSIFWDNDNIAFWYRQNIMLFVKNDISNDIRKKFKQINMPTDLVHPVKLENIANDCNKYENMNKILNDEIDIKNGLIDDLSIKLENYKERCEYMKKELNNINVPKVSVVVPVFNVKNFLRECLDSILTQTLKDIEVLCGDGGSNDGSLEILKEYEKKDKRVKVISREGSGYGQSVNECMDIAKGEYIGLVESDDKIDPIMYETLYNIAKTNDLDWIRSDIYFYYSGMPKGKQLSRESITYGGNYYNQVLNPQNDIRPFKSALHTWAGIYSRDFLNRNHIRHHETPGGSYQDVGFYLKTLYDAERVYFLDKPFYMWRQDNPGSSIHYNAKKLVEKSFYEWDLNKKFLELRPNTSKRIWGSFNYRRYYSYLWTIDMAQELKEETEKKVKIELRQALKEEKVQKEFFDESEWIKFNKFLK